jgi:hypothetical protein
MSPLSPSVPGICATGTASNNDAAVEAFEERAAIMEFDGGMTWEDAEAMALTLTRQLTNGNLP